MARRPLAFGVRFRDRGRSVRVRRHERDDRRYVVEIEQRDRSACRREHGSLADALADFAASWRARLH